MNKILYSAAAISSLSVHGAYAQTLDARTEDNVKAKDVIIVTAQRREQSPQDVAIALNAFDHKTLNDAGVRKVDGLETISPSLEIESQFGSGQPSFSIRGVGFRDYATLNAPTVGVYVDDVAYPIPIMTQGVLFDVDRVEVLRGPQGTLYGRNTTGGAIKIISARPTEDFSAGLTLEGGRFGRFDGEGFISGPVTEAIRLRLSGATTQGGAWQINRETGEKIGAAEQYALRGVAEIDLAQNVMATVNLHGFIDKSDGLGLQLFNDSVFGPLAHQGRRETSFGSSDEFAQLIGIDPGEHPFRNNEGWGGNLTIDAEFGAIDVTYIGAYESLQRKEFNDFDALTIGGAGVYFDSDADVFSHELRVSGDTAPNIRWIVGAYYAQEDLDEIYQSDFVASFGPGFAVTTPYAQHVRTAAVYGHGEINLTSTLTFVGGLRFEDESRELNDLGTFATGFGTLNFANGTIDGTLENRALTSDNLTGKASIEFRPVKNALLYASYSRGVKSGGFTAYNTLNPNALDPFMPEKLTAYETGFKTSIADQRLQLNGAAFYYDYKDQQVQSAIFDPATTAIVGRIVNAPKSYIWGGELEALLRVTENLTIGQALGYKEGEFEDFIDLDTGATALAGMAVTVDRSGQQLGFPKISYQGFAEAKAAMAAGWRARARFDYAYRSSLALPLLGEPYRVDDYWVANGLIAIAPDNEKWELAFWGRNIFNARYDETRNFFIAPGGVADVAAPGLPATYGVRLSVRF